MYDNYESINAKQQQNPDRFDTFGKPVNNLNNNSNTATINTDRQFQNSNHYNNNNVITSNSNQSFQNLPDPPLPPNRLRIHPCLLILPCFLVLLLMIAIGFLIYGAVQKFL